MPEHPNRHTLVSMESLRAAEPAILDAIAAHKHGVELFVCHPLRFLREAGFEVGAALERELRAALPLDRLPALRYEDVAAGKATPFGSPQVRVRVRLTGLGLDEVRK